MTGSYFILLVLVLGIGLYGFYLFRRARRGGTLTLSDHLGIANLLVATVIGIVALAIAVASFKVAFDSYREAKASGEEQLSALQNARAAILTTGTEQKSLLDKSASALQLMLDSAHKQQAILDKSLQTSQTQLSLLLEQKRREAERPDVRLIPLQPKELELMIYNASGTKIAKDVHYAVSLMIVDRPATSGVYPAFSTETTNIDYIRPSSAYAPSILRFHNGDSIPVTKGARLFGWASITCPDCAKDRVYWVYWKYQEAGYYLESEDGKMPFGQMPAKTPETILDEFLHMPGIIPILD